MSKPKFKVGDIVRVSGRNLPPGPIFEIYDRGGYAYYRANIRNQSTILFQDEIELVPQEDDLYV